MKQVLFIMCILLSSMAGIAKDSIDLLTRQLSTHTAPDTTQVNLLNKLGYEYWIVNPAQSEILGKKALQLAHSLSYKEGKAFANRIIGVSLWARGQYPDALHYLLDGLTIYQQIGHNAGIGAMYSNIGLVYHDQINYDAALRCFYQAIAAYEREGITSKKAAILSNIGNTYLQMKDFTKAEKIYLQVLRLNQTSGRKYGIAESLSNLGELHLMQNKPDKALTYLTQSLQIRTSLEDHEGAAMCRYLIGKVYLCQQKYPLARQNLHAGLNKALQVNSLKWLTHMYETLKEVEVAASNYQQAINYFEAFTAYKDSLFNS